MARALGTLPLLAEVFARGELSYAKVRALTRVATPETESRLLGVGRGGTAAHVERIVQAWRWADRKAEARDATRQHANRALRVHQDDDGTVVLRGRLEPEVGALFVKALAAARETLYQRGPTVTRFKLGDRLDLGYAIDVLHPLANPLRGSSTREGPASTGCQSGHES